MLKTVKECPVCGKRFEAQRSTKRFCSTNCRVKNAHARDWERKKGAREASAEKAGYPVYHCGMCGTEMHAWSDGRRCFCGDDCRRVWKGRDMMFRKGNGAEVHCKVCGKRFAVRAANDVFCSAACKDVEAARHRKKAAARKAPEKVERYTPDEAARERARIQDDFRARSRLLMGF